MAARPVAEKRRAKRQSELSTTKRFAQYAGRASSPLVARIDGAKTYQEHDRDTTLRLNWRAAEEDRT
jgi:hypothetical protein